jgi:hypothetical protein
MHIVVVVPHITTQGYNTTLKRDAFRARSQRRIGRGLWTTFQSLEERGL